MNRETQTRKAKELMNGVKEYLNRIPSHIYFDSAIIFIITGITHYLLFDHFTWKTIGYASGTALAYIAGISMIRYLTGIQRPRPKTFKKPEFQWYYPKKEDSIGRKIWDFIKSVFVFGIIAAVVISLFLIILADHQE